MNDSLDRQRNTPVVIQCSNERAIVLVLDETESNRVLTFGIFHFCRSYLSVTHAVIFSFICISAE